MPWNNALTGGPSVVPSGSPAKFSKILNEKEWNDHQNQYNDGRIDSGQVVYPTWHVTSKKRIRLEYNFASGNAYVRMERIPDNMDFSKLSVLKLDMSEWSDLKDRVLLMERFINAVEQKGDETVLQVLKYWKIEEYKGQVFCRIPLNAEIKLTFKWSDKDHTCYIDIRRGSDVMSKDGNTKYWKGSEQGICFNGSTCKYFLHSLIPKVTNGTRMWAEMHNAGCHMWKSLFSTYKSEGGKGKLTWVRFNPVEDDEEMETDAVCGSAPFHFINCNYPDHPLYGHKGDN
jgi:hypothetical protein